MARFFGLGSIALLSVTTLHAQAPVRPQNGSFTAAWQPVGPNTVASISYGALSGRVLSLASDPNDTTGNTLYVGTAGGGVWKSTNAAAPVAAVTFSPLTDSLPVFSAGSGAVPSLFIGAVAVQPVPNPIVLAGTGDPDNSTDSYYGEGILRSADGGLTWALLQRANDLPNATESFLGLSAAAFAWSTTTPSLAVAAFTTSPLATAVQATKATSVPGLYYSADAGATWHMASVYDGANVVQQPQPAGAESGNAATAVVWNPQRKQFIAALRAHGYYASSDGVTWKRLDAQPGTGLSASNCPVGVNGTGSTACPVFRAALAVQPVTGDTFAWTIDSSGREQGVWQDQCLLSSAGVCAAPTAAFTTRLDHGELDLSGSTVVQGGLNALSLTAAPLASNGTALLAGAIDVYRCSLSSGAPTCTFRNATNALNGCATPAAVAPGQHALAAVSIAGSTTPAILLGNEGGLWRSLDSVNVSGTSCSASDGSHFDNLNAGIGSGGSLANVVGLAQHPTDPVVFLAGLGSNGTAATTSASGTAPWLQLSPGGGGYPHIDSANPTNWYAAIGAGVNLKSCTAGSVCTASDFAPPATIGPTQVSNDPSLIHAPTLLDPTQSSNLLVGTCRVWRGPASTGDAWSGGNAISAPFAGSAPCSASSPLVRSLAAAGPSVIAADAQHSGATVIYAGMAGLLDGGGVLGGNVYMTKSANTATSATRWTEVSSGTVTNDTFYGGVFNPLGFAVSSIAVDSHDATGATAYVTLAGFVGPRFYRTTDFGAHWTDLSSNLPFVPANSVVVDPNDANTVYAALDSGVYATAAINTCVTANCWTLLGTGLPNAPVTQIRAGEHLPTGDGYLGMLRASTFGRGLWQIPLLASTAVVAPSLTASPTSLSFDAQQAGTQSAAQTVTLTNSGNAPASVSSITLPTGFVESDNCVGQPIAVGSFCSVQVRFAPVAAGPASGTLTVFANVPGGQVTIALSGTATAPASVVLTPNALTFPATVVQQASAVQNISVANTGGVTSTLQSPVISGDFVIAASTCGATLAPQTACTISIQFKPTDKGTRTGTFILTDSVGSQMASLSGTGQSPATDTISTSSLAFTQQAIGTRSTSQQLTLTNAGDTSLFINAVTTAGDFAATSDCGAIVPGHTTCAVLVSFVPSAVGTRSGTLTIEDQFRSQTVALSGVAVAPAGVSLTPNALAFGSIAVGLSAPAQTITLTNNGGLPLNIAKQSISGDFSIATSTCGAVLAVNTACVTTIVFTPQAAGVRAGALTLVDDAPSGTQTVSLSGSGVDFTFAASSATSQTVRSGSTATYVMAVNSPTGLGGNVSFACTGAPAHSLCTVNPATVSLGGNATVIATVQTGLSTATLQPFRPWMLYGSGTLALALVFPLCWPKRKRRRLALTTVSAALLIASAGCGTPRLIPGSGGSAAPVVPTPSGTYTLTVTATSAGISHSVPLTLIVQ